MHNKVFEPWRHQECRARITERTSLGEKFTNGTVLFLNCYFSFYERSIEMVFEMFGEKSKQYYTTLHYTVLNHTSLHYTTWPCTSLDCTVSCAHNRCGRPGRGEAGYWNTLPPLGTALDRRGLSQLDYLGHCPLLGTVRLEYIRPITLSWHPAERGVDCLLRCCQQGGGTLRWTSSSLSQAKGWVGIKRLFPFCPVANKCLYVEE